MSSGSPAICLDTSMIRLETIHLIEAMEWMFFAHAHNERLQVDLVFRDGALRGLSHACGKLVSEEHHLPGGGSIESDTDFLLYRWILEIRKPEGTQANRAIIVEVVSSFETFRVHINRLVQEGPNRPAVLVD